MTKVVCFHAKGLQPKTTASVLLYAPGAEFVDCSASDYDYWLAFKARWNTGDDLVTIEQDNEIKADTISQFDNCPEPWCVFPYRVANAIGQVGDVTESLGCARFSAELQARVKVRHISQDDYRHWTQVADRVAVTLVLYGYRSHVHDTLPHHHDAADYANRLDAIKRARAKNEASQEYQNAKLMPAAKPSYWDKFH